MTAGPIAFVTDLHLDPDCADAVLDAFDDALDRIRDRDPARIVVGGDVVQDTSPEADRRMLRRVVGRLDDAPCPYFVLRGNHDVERLTPGAFADVVGHERFRIDRDAGLVYLDSSAPRLAGSRGEVDGEQLDALSSALDDGDLDDALVFVHHPIHYRRVDDNFWFAGHPEEAFCGNKRAVRELLEPAEERVAGVLNGHLHEWHHVESGGLAHFSVDAFNKRRHPTGRTGAFAILDREDGLSVDYYAGDGTDHRIRIPAGDGRDDRP